MLNWVSYTFFTVALLLFTACEPCRHEEHVYLGNSIDLLDNAGRSPISLKGDEAKAKSLGIYIQFEYNKVDPDVCIYGTGDIPTSFKVFTIHQFNASYLANSEMSSVFTLLNSKLKYPVPLTNASLRDINYLLLNVAPTIDTIQQFIINGYRNDILISSDTTRPIVINR